MIKIDKRYLSAFFVFFFLYYEAMQMGQNPQEVVKQYQEAGYLPAIKMSMIEEKVISKLLDEKLGK